MILNTISYYVGGISLTDHNQTDANMVLEIEKLNVEKLKSNMKEIKKINIEDCVWCYVSDHMEKPNNQFNRVKIVFRSYDNGYVDINGDYWKYAIPCEELDNPPKPKWSDKYPAEWTIHAKLFKAINEGAVIKRKSDSLIRNDFFNNVDTNEYQICTNYTGTESDVWEDIE